MLNITWCSIAHQREFTKWYDALTPSDQQVADDIISILVVYLGMSSCSAAQLVVEFDTIAQAALAARSN